MGADTYAGIGAAFSRISDIFANKMQMNADEKRQNAYEIALEKRRIAEEERVEKKTQETPVRRSSVYKGVGEDGPGFRVDRLNARGDVVDTQDANPRERGDYEETLSAREKQAKADQEKARMDAEDRDLNRRDKESGMSARSIRAQAAKLRAERTGLSEEKSEKELTRNEALKALSSFRYRAEEGGNARDVAKRDGLTDDDYDDLVRLAGSGKPKEPGALERGINAVGNAFSSFAERVKSKNPVMAERKPGKPGKKDSAPPVQGARKSPRDGKWYVQRDGKWMLVEE